MDKQLNYIQTKQIDAIAAGDNGFKVELITIFLEQIEEFVSNMKAFLTEENWILLAREAHTAKSSAMTFGMEETGQLLKTIQLDCEAKKLKNVSKLVAQATADLQQAVPELIALKESLQS